MMCGASGPRLRTDLVEVYVFRRGRAGAEFLQLRRARAPQQGAWHPVIGHVESGETALRAAVREAREEVGLRTPGADALAMWQLEQVHPFFLAHEDAIVLCPRLVIEARPAWSPTLNAEHSDSRWVGEEDAVEAFVWPGQRAACAEALEEIVRANRYQPLTIPA